MNHRNHLFLSLLFALGCGDATAPSGDVGELPGSVQIMGAADSTYADGSTVSCSFTLNLTLAPDGGVRDGARRYVGTMGGESHRQALDPEGNGVGFFADMAWPDARAKVIGPDSVELRPSGRDTISRFWDGFHLFAATRTADGHLGGTWECAPFDIWEDGYVDTMLIARGTWEVIAP